MGKMENQAHIRTKKQDLLLLEQNLSLLFDIISAIILLFQCYFFLVLTSDKSLLILPTLIMIPLSLHNRLVKIPTAKCIVPCQGTYLPVYLHFVYLFSNCSEWGLLPETDYIYFICHLQTIVYYF